MPELPEVHTIVTDLKNNIVGYSILRAWVSSGYPKIKDAAEFTKRVSGQKIKDVKRIAKNILVELESGDYIHIHLAMTGQVFLLDPSQKAGKRAHVVFHIAKDKKSLILTYGDTRMFGRLELITQDHVNKLKEKYGMEPVSESSDVHELYGSLKNRKAIIKNILMDQSIIAGLGNIYATEALFLAKIHPQTQMRYISKEQFTDLMEAASNILKNGN